MYKDRIIFGTSPVSSHSPDLKELSIVLSHVNSSPKQSVLASASFLIPIFSSPLSRSCFVFPGAKICFVEKII